jgi:subtilisin-like proprotein convertase family protein
MRTKIFSLFLAGGILGLCHKAVADTYTASYSVDATIPDNDLTGLAETENISTSITSISDVQVTLDIAGAAGSTAFNGDFYAYLTDGTGFAILLNRVGAVSGNDYGYSDDGLDVTFSDTAADGNIHFYGSGSYSTNSSGQVIGTYQPDGRNISPTNSGAVLAATTPAALLSSFDGLDPNGTWTLFVADASGGDVGELVSWDLTVDGSEAVASSVPDGGSTLALLSFVLGVAILASRRFRQPA